MSKEHTKVVFFICGTAGSGKLTALNAFKDIGFNCVDNLPVELLGDFAEFVVGSDENRFALLLNVDGGESPTHLEEAVQSLEKGGYLASFLYFDAQDEVLLRRFRETRRPHPFLVKKSPKPGAGEGAQTVTPHSTIAEALAAERLALKTYRTRAERIFDTSYFSPHQLRGEIESLLEFKNELKIQVLSFGFKYGAPKDADLVMDVRFLPNPYFVQELREHNGRDEPVRDYVFSSGEAEEFLGHLERMLEFLLPKYEAEGKRYLTLAIGCTGGKHRSVALTEKISSTLEDKGHKISAAHRDLVQPT